MRLVQNHLRSRIWRSVEQIRPHWPLKGKMGAFFLSFVISFAIAYLSMGNNPGVNIVPEALIDLRAAGILFITLFAIFLWISDAIPPFAVSLLIIAFHVFWMSRGEGSGTDASLIRYTSSWSSPVIWILLGGFFLSLALSRSQQIKDLTRAFIRRFEANTKLFLLVIMYLVGLMSMVMSNTASTALVLGVLMPWLSQKNMDVPLRKVVLMSIPLAAAIGGMGTLIGSPPNAIAHHFLQSSDVRLGFVSWLSFGIPISVLLIAGMWLFLISRFEFPARLVAADAKATDAPALVSMSPRDEMITMVVLAITILLWLSAPLTELSTASVALIPIVGLSMAGVVRSEDLRLIPWETLILVAGGLVLGEGLVDSKLIAVIAEAMPAEAQDPLWNLPIVALVTLILSNIMSNTAAAAVLIPVFAYLFPNIQLQAALTVALASSGATLLPISTPPNAIIASTGYLHHRQFVATGLVLGLAVVLLVPLLVILITPRI